ncbi:hypothetical protein GCM10022289_19190 [Pedobacter jeongneungensis]|uniref:Apea-like HEPN domain-containing protein n=2 Tax=Pedobacter jeongneungensis TaxID=947309 RepID=A0ABP8BC51_9SPHI
MANGFLEENISIKTKLTAKWEQERVESNIAHLKEIIAGLNKELGEKAIKDHVQESLIELMSHKKAKKKSMGAKLLKNFTENMVPYEIARYSLNYSIENDFYWTKDGTIGDHYEVALGIRDPETFGVYCGEKIAVIKETVLPYLKDYMDYNVDLLNSVVINFEQQQPANSNILLMVVIEGMLRAMCTKLYLRQNPAVTQQEATKFVRKYQSMESLIIKPDWKNDIQYDFFAAVNLAKHIDDPQLDQAKEKLRVAEKFQKEILSRSARVAEVLADPTLTDEDKQDRAMKITNAALEDIAPWVGFEKQPVYVSIKVELQFLVRRFKDDRNEMIHGGYESYNKKWKSNSYLAAVIATCNLMKKLDRIYGDVIAANSFAIAQSG